MRITVPHLRKCTVENDQRNIFRLAHQQIDAGQEFTGGLIQRSFDMAAGEVIIAHVDDKIVLSRDFVLVFDKLSDLLPR